LSLYTLSLHDIQIISVMLNIALFGPPGAGKGTQSKMLLEKYNLAYIATGDILRKEIAEGTKIGKAAKDIIEKGGLVSDELIVQIIEKYIESNYQYNGFLFDGFPRTFVQAYILEGLLLKFHTSLTCMISLEVPKNVLITRLSERSKTSDRADDSPEVIKTRLEEYDNKTAPVAEFYKDKKIYFPLDGIGKVEDVFARIDLTIERMLEKKWFNLVLFGYPGAGKGTQAKRLAEEYNMVYISTGDMLRQEIAKKTEIGQKVQPFMEKGLIVPDEIAIKLIEFKIKTSTKTRGFIYKGFPRTLVQAYILDGLLRKQNSSVNHVIHFDIPTLEAIKRLSARSKTSTARNYDTTTDMIIQRMDEFETITSPVANYYQKQGKFTTINGANAEDVVYQDIKAVVDKAIRFAR